MWTARHYTWTRPNSHNITLRRAWYHGLCPSRYAGVSSVCQDVPVWAVAGDGGIQMNIQGKAGHLASAGRLRQGRYQRTNGHLGMAMGNGSSSFHARNYSETPITGPGLREVGRTPTAEAAQ